MTIAVVSIHDVAPATFAQSAAWLDRVESHGLRTTLLVVPGPWRSAGVASDPAFVSWLHGARTRGHELSLHGWEHRGVELSPDVASPSSWVAALRHAVGRVMARGCGEFHSLGRFEAKRRLRLGRTALDGIGVHVHGFTPPGWLISSDAIAALRQLEFSYTTTQWSVIDLASGRKIRIPAVSHRPGSRVAHPAAHAVRHLVEHRARRAKPIRVALHPDDLSDPGLVEATDRMLGALATASRAGRMKVLTYLELIDGAARHDVREVA